jgi:tetratricopeptide (TPR) repeat protein
VADQPTDKGTPQSVGTLATVAVGDPGTLETLAAHNASDSGMLDTLAASNVGDSGTLDTLTASAPVAGGKDPVLGTRMGRYVLLGELGRGGMGVVYSAFDPELDRKVALKVLRPGSSSDATEAAARLQREGRAIAKLAHPNVVAVFDVGAEGGNVFVAMELVDGGSLDRWIAAESRDWREVVDVFLQAGEGLAAAHAAGMIHRDFKPANVLIGTDGRARVTDFGLARPTQRTGDTTKMPKRSGSDVELTQTGAMVGTPAYMPPEQFDAEPLDARSDQFSFAVSLYEGLYGERPYAGSTIGEIYDAITSGQIPSAPARSMVPTWLRNVLLRALAAKPDRRYPTLTAMLAELRRDPSSRRRLVAGIGAATALLGAGIFTVATHRAADPCAHAGDQIDAVGGAGRGNSIRAKLLATNRPYAASTADTVIERFGAYASRWRLERRETCAATRRRGERSETLLDRRMICLDRLLGELGARVNALDGTGEAPIDKAVELTLRLPSLDACADEKALLAAIPPPTDPIVRARSAELDRRVSRAATLDDLGKYDEGAALAKAVIAEAATLENPAVLARAQCAAGTLAIRLAGFAAAETYLLDCAKSAARAHDDALAANAWIGLLGVVGFHQSQFKEGLRFAGVAEAALLRAGNPSDVRAKLQFTHGLVLDVSGQWDAAYPLTEQAYKTWSEAGPAHNEANALNALNSLGGIRQQQGRYKDAQAIFERGVAERERLLGREHPMVVSTLQNLALTYSSLGDRERALATFDDALARAEKALGPEHPDVARILTNRASTREGMGQHEQGLADERRALAIREKVHGPDDPEVALTLGNMAATLGDLGRFDEALVAFARARAIDEKAFGADSRQVAYNDVGVARVYYRMQDLPKALAAFQRALAIEEKAVGADHASLASTLSSIGIIVLDLGQLDAAEKHLGRALAIREKTLGPDHPDLGYDLGALAGVLMKRGKAADAIPVAERALELRTAGKVDPGLITEATYFVGEAMWLAGKDRARAMKLITEARAGYVKAGEGWAEGVKEVDRFLKTKRP